MKPHEIETLYREMLDECYPPYELGGNISFMPSDVIENCDHTFFRIGLAEYAYQLLEDKHITEEEYDAIF